MMITEPGAIEKRSMEIIESELGTRIDEETKDVVMRVIHCTADFEYARSLAFSVNAVKNARKALAAGNCTIVTDTQMACSGINKAAAGKLGCALRCFMSDADVAAEAKERGCTRAQVSMERAANIKGNVIFAIGNAPTALLALAKAVREGRIKPVLIIGMPVGFVNVIESKEEIMECGAEYIVARGRKGGSNVAAAAVNALLYGITR